MTCLWCFYDWQLEPPCEQDVHLARTSPGIVLDPRLQHMWFKCFTARTNLTENKPPPHQGRYGTVHLNAMCWKTCGTGRPGTGAGGTVDQKQMISNNHRLIKVNVINVCGQAVVLIRANSSYSSGSTKLMQWSFNGSWRKLECLSYGASLEFGGNLQSTIIPCVLDCPPAVPQ